MSQLPGQMTTVDGPPSMAVHTYKSGTAERTRVIFVHGTPGAGDGWADYLSNPPEGAEYVAIDRPGFGASIPRQAFVSLKDQAAALEPFFDRKSSEKVILVGHSLGGPIIAQAAVDFSGKIDALVIVAGSLDPSLEKIHPMQFVGEWWPFVWILPRMLRHSNRELLALKAELESLEPRLADILVPVIIVHGTEDGLVPYANVEFMQRKLTNAEPVEVITLEGANHFLPWNAKPTIDSAISRAETLARVR